MSNSGNYRGDDNNTKIIGRDGLTEADVLVDGSVHRVATDTKVSGINPAPVGNLVHGVAYLENGSNRSMDVNGSITPQVFEAEVPPGETWYITSLHLYLSDNEIKSRTKYGDISELTNGLLSEFQINSTGYTHSIVKNNIELGLVFVSDNGGGKRNDELAADKPAYFGESMFDPPVTLLAGDKVKVTVRDNLSGLDGQRMSVNYWRAI